MIVPKCHQRSVKIPNGGTSGLRKHILVHHASLNLLGDSVTESTSSVRDYLLSDLKPGMSKLRLLLLNVLI